MANTLAPARSSCANAHSYGARWRHKILPSGLYALRLVSNIDLSSANDYKLTLNVFNAAFPNSASLVQRIAVLPMLLQKRANSVDCINMYTV